MACIDFDKGFETFIHAFIKEHGDLYQHNMEVLEKMLPDLYLQFLDTEADFLGGKKPGEYFSSFTDVKELMQMLADYRKENIPVPDPLLERITDLGSEAENALLDLLATEKDPEMRMTAINLLNELQSSKPMQLYIRYIAEMDAEDEEGDACSEALIAMGKEVVAPILKELNTATEAGRDVFADILSNFPFNEEIFKLLVDRFANREEKKAFFASCLSKYGDPRALPMLKSAAAAVDINYLDYIEVVNAIESLGGERPAEREFGGDPYYEALSRMQ